jgi:hypothetical protein
LPTFLSVLDVVKLAALLLCVLLFGVCWQDLKQLLNTALGVGCHRIKPRQKGDKFLHVHFISKEEMDIARTLLHGQIILGSRLTAVVSGKLLIVSIAPATVALPA